MSLPTDEADVEHPLISVVIPCYNLADFLGDAVESALAQTYRPLEVIVVNDGSSDESADVARRYAADVRLVEQPNRGLAAARNTGMTIARGAFVAFLDADDRLEPEYIERCYRALRSSPACAYAYTQVRFFGARDGESAFPTFDLDALKEKNFVHATALLRSGLVRRFPYCEDLREGWEDWDLYLTLAEHGYEGVLVDLPLLNYRQRSGSMLDDFDGERRLRLRGVLIRRHRRLYGWRRYVASTAVRLRHGVAQRVVPGRRRQARRG